MVNLGLDGNRWDGSSCFNFMKELAFRYGHRDTGAKNEVFACTKATRIPINDESAKKVGDKEIFSKYFFQGVV